MLTITIILMPFVLGLLLTALLAAQKHKTFAQRAMVAITPFGSIYFLTMGLQIAPGMDPTIHAYGSLGNAASLPFMEALCYLYFWALSTNHQRCSTLDIILILIPTFNLIGLIASTYFLGMERAIVYLSDGGVMPTFISGTVQFAYRTFDTFAVQMYKLLGLGGLVLLNFMIVYDFVQTDFHFRNIWRFFLQGGPLKPLHLQMFLVILLLVLSLMGLQMTPTQLFYIWWPLISICILTIGVISLFIKRPTLHLRPFRRPEFNDIPVRIERSNISDIEAEEQLGYKALSLRKEFHFIMREHLCFLQPGLNRFSTASMLGVPPSTLDALVHFYYGMPYEQYVQYQRVQYMIRYREHYPHKPLQEIAAECGFKSLASMRRQYTEVIGTKL